MTTLMRVPFTVLLLLSLGIFACSDRVSGQKGEMLLTTMDSVSYGIGTDIGANIKMQGFDSLRMNGFHRGLNDAMNDSLRIEGRALGLIDMNDSISYQFGARLGLDLRNGGVDSLNNTFVSKGALDAAKGQEDSLTTTIRTLSAQYLLNAQKLAMAKQREEQMRMMEENQKAGEAFLAENEKQEGIMVTASGLQYKVIKTGTGARPGPTQRVDVDYEGTLINGQRFDGGKGIQFGLDGVIKGWTEGIQLMKEGGEFRFFIPSELAYGPSRGPGGTLPPNSVLIFDVKLNKVNP